MLPGDILAQRDDRHGDVSKDEHGEHQQIEDLTGLGAVDLLLLRNQRDDAERQQAEVDAEQAAAQTGGRAPGHDQRAGGQTGQQAPLNSREASVSRVAGAMTISIS